MVQRAVMLGVTGTVDLADWADIPLAMDINMPKVVALKACLLITGVVARKRGVHRHAMNGFSGIILVAKFIVERLQKGEVAGW